jgi:hypothetical protein
MSQIQIPSTLDSAGFRLAVLDSLSRATGWERASIVWAFSSNNLDKVGKSPHKISFREFAAKGFAGLRDHHTVAAYHDSWQTAIDDGDAKPVAPGDEVMLPDRPYPPRSVDDPGLARGVRDPERRERLAAQAQADGVGVSKVLDVASNPKAVAAAIKADPKLAEAAREALVSTKYGKAPDMDYAVPTDGDPIQSFMDMEEEDFHAAHRALLTARDMSRRAAELVGKHAQLAPQSARFLNEPIDQIRTALELVEVIVNEGGVTDEAIAALLSGGAS